MKNKLHLLLFLSAIIIFTSSCVSMKKYRLAESRIASLRNDSAAFNAMIKNISSESASTKKNLSQQLQDKITELDKKQNELNEKQKLLGDRELKIKELQGRIDQENAIVNKLKTTVANALINYPADVMTVSIKDGKVYVSLAEKLLFPSGSAIVNKEGKDAIGKLAEVLNNNKDINVLIEGHTDSIPIKGKFADNWDLSTARATSIVRVLTVNNNVDPTRVTASGRGEFFPVDTNKTPEGRARNRRTEIILSPNLEELYKLIYQ